MVYHVSSTPTNIDIDAKLLAKAMRLPEGKAVEFGCADWWPM